MPELFSQSPKLLEVRFDALSPEERKQQLVALCDQVAEWQTWERMDTRRSTREKGSAIRRRGALRSRDLPGRP